MRDVKVLMVLSIAALALSGQASAADRAIGTYIGAGAGANITQGTELNGNGTANELDQSYDRIWCLNI